MKKKIILLAAVVILAAAGVFIYRVFFSAETGKMIYVAEAVNTQTLMTTISASGNLSPEDEVEVGTQVSGDISKIYVDFNDEVKKGQLLAELDKSKLQSALLQAEVAFKSAQNDYTYKKSVYERTQKLAESGSANKVDLESAEYAMNDAQYALERSKNDVNQAKINLNYCLIRSPIDGVVLERSVDVGQTVAASMSAPTLFILANDLTQMEVMAAVDEADVGGVRPGQRVEFTVDAFPDDTFGGSVQQVRLNPTSTSNVITYTVVISAENPDKKLLPGMTATCTIVTEEIKDAVTVPVAALKFNPSESAPDFSGKGNREKRSGSAEVWILRGGKPVPRQVKTGLSDGVVTQILEGVSVGDSVVVREELEVKSAKEKAAEKSPFMPSRSRRR